MALTKVSGGMASSEIANVLDYGADNTGVADSTSAFQDALDNNKAVFVPDGIYLIDGTIELNKGNTLFGNNFAGTDGAYDFANLGNTTRLFKNSGSTGSPIVDMADNSALRGLLFYYGKTGGAPYGIIQFPGDAYTRFCTIEGCHIEGAKVGTASSATGCIGIKFEGRTSPYVSYFNRISNVQVHNCDICFFLGNQANANTFTNIQTKESHVHYFLNGQGGEALENSFVGLGLFSISGSLSPSPVGFKLVDANKNNFIGFNTEMFGKAYEVDSATCSGNVFQGTVNEVTSSQADGQSDLSYQKPVNVSNVNKMRLVTGTAGTRYDTGSATTWTRVFQIDGTLPQQNNNTGTLTAGDADNKVIFRFPENFSKAAKTSFIGKLRVIANGAFGNGECLVQVEFGYRKSNTTSSAGEFEVYRVDQTGNEITGLYFLTGVAASEEMGVALVGGNYGASAFGYIRCHLEIFASAYDSFSDSFNDWENLTSTTATDVTANDVTDSISMLSTGTTSV